MHNSKLVLLAAALGLSAVTATQAAEKYPWRDHRRPFTFLFGNSIDSHQQTREEHDGSLNGYLYVWYTGTVTKDNYPVATHVDCNDRAAACKVGWKIDARQSRAKLVLQPMHDHPVFLLRRPDIPQPGSHAHFHWTGAMPMLNQSANGYLLELTAVNSFCFIHHDANLATSAWSCRDNKGVAVERGVDIATHLNIVTNEPNGM